jgi:pyruvate/2-oxoglutarate dehydrogenase complex dihydrolipoamide acyltransferase (E2) component
MKTPVILPSLGEAIATATVSQWLKAVGDLVAEGEPLVEVSTDKVDTEIESPTTGILVEIRVNEDEIAVVGDIMAVINGDMDEPTPSNPSVPPALLVTPFPGTAPTHEARARQRTAAVTAVPVEASQIVAAVIEVPANAQDRTTTAAALRGTTQPLSRLRKTIARRMIESLQTSAQLTTIVEVDVTEVGDARRRHNAALTLDKGLRLSFLPFIAAAAVEVLRTYPQINSSIDLEAGTVTYPDTEHLGIAVDTERGLLVPVVRDAGSLSVTGLAARITDLAERSRTNRIGVDELSGGTFTITNTGSRGALMDTPIINQPQVAILGAGVVTRRPVILGREGEDESIAIRSMVYLSLTYDHRLVDGADAARYLSAVKTRLEHGNFGLE